MARTGSGKGPKNELELANHRGRLDLSKMSAKNRNNYLRKTRFSCKRFPGTTGEVVSLLWSLFDDS